MATMHSNDEHTGIADGATRDRPPAARKAGFAALGALLGFMRGTFPDESFDPNVVLIGLTPLDMYNAGRDWHFAFGVKGIVEDPKAVISTFRMNPQTFGDFPDDGLLFSRAQKMVSRYIGFFYYRLPANSDSESLLYSSILSLRDLGRLQGPLPVTQDP